MSTKFKILLLGQAGAGKSTFISSLSEINIYDCIASKKGGGANTTKITTTYEFDTNCSKLEVVDCLATEAENQEQITDELRNLSKQQDGVKKVFGQINSDEFSKKCIAVFLKLPCKKGIIPDNCKFDTITVTDSRGFGDISDTSFNIEDFSVTQDVNAILLFSITATEPPAIFGTIIDQIMKVNLKTPIFLLRRDEDFLQNDDEFEKQILNNIQANDMDLYKAALDVSNAKTMRYRLGRFVFYLPEVKKWKGALNYNEDAYYEQVNNYNTASKEIIEYAIKLYEKLYSIIVDKMNNEYKDLFTKNILDNLCSNKSLKCVANIAIEPNVKVKQKGGKVGADRDTQALKRPVNLINPSYDTIHPFENEMHRAGNRYTGAIIPFYSNSCVNFRAVFSDVVTSQINSIKLNNISALLHTFMDLALERYTVTAYTGFTSKICCKNAFKFNLFLQVRDDVTNFLIESNQELVYNDQKTWHDFTYKLGNQKFSDSSAIAILFYRCLLRKLNLSEEFTHSTKVDKQGSEYVDSHNRDEILLRISKRKS